jgi:hypothetical protein
MKKQGTGGISAYKRVHKALPEIGIKRIASNRIKYTWSTYMCVYIYIYIYIYMCVCVCVCVCVNVRFFVQKTKATSR